MKEYWRQEPTKEEYKVQYSKMTFFDKVVYFLIWINFNFYTFFTGILTGLPVNILTILATSRVNSFFALNLFGVFFFSILSVLCFFKLTLYCMNIQQRSYIFNSEPNINKFFEGYLFFKKDIKTIMIITVTFILMTLLCFAFTFLNVNSNYTLYYPDGRIKYQGGWKYNKEFGKGKSYSMYGDVIYSGKWIDGKKSGYGQEFYKNKVVKYSGYWKDDKYSGTGNLYSDSGKIVLSGNWVNGVFQDNKLFNSNGIVLKQLKKVKILELSSNDVFILNTGEKVRLIGIVRNLNENAKKYIETNLVGKTMYIDTDKSDYDEQGNLLSYMYCEDGTFVNEYLIKEGLCEASYNLPNIKYINSFLNAEIIYKSNK